MGAVLKLIFLIYLLPTLVGCTNPKDAPKYLQQLSSSNAHTRSQAATALGRIGAPHAKIAVSRLISLLNDSNPGVASAAAYALREIDTPSARKALAARKQFK